MSWYCVYGDPRWDADELWTTMGHLYKGGIWFKKKSVLQAENHYDTEKSADGTTDMRSIVKSYDNSSSSINSGVPSEADAGNYFYLPALGSYFRGQLVEVGNSTLYWSSSASPSTNDAAYALGISSGFVNVYSSFSREVGGRVRTLE